jgi:hypothetical protein
LQVNYYKEELKMEYMCIFVVVGVLMCAGVARIVDKVAEPIANRLARREWNRIVMRNLKRQQKAAWKREVFSVAKNYRELRYED